MSISIISKDRSSTANYIDIMVFEHYFWFTVAGTTHTFWWNSPRYTKESNLVEILVFGVYKNPLLLRETHMLGRTMLITFLDRRNSENREEQWKAGNSEF